MKSLRTSLILLVAGSALTLPSLGGPAVAQTPQKDDKTVETPSASLPYKPCTNRPAFKNPWPTWPQATRDRRDLHAACELVVRDVAMMAVGLRQQGIDRKTAEMSSGGEEAEPGSLIHEFAPQIVEMAYQGKSRDEIERAHFCTCLDRPVGAAEGGGASAYR